MAPPSSAKEREYTSAQSVAGQRGRRSGSRSRRSKRLDVSQTAKTTANASQETITSQPATQSNSEVVGSEANAPAKANLSTIGSEKVSSYAEAASKMSKLSYGNDDRVPEVTTAMGLQSIPMMLPLSSTIETPSTISIGNIKDGAIAGQSAVNANKRKSGNEAIVQTSRFVAPAVHSCHTSPSTDGTIVSGFTDDIVGDYLAKITTRTGRPQTFYYTKNSRYPHASLVLLNLPWSVTYDLVLDIVKHYGDIAKFFWSPIDPCTCEVMYLDASAAECALNLLDRSVVFEGHPPIRAKLKATDPNLQLLVTNVAGVINEDDLEKHFQGIVSSTVYAILKRSPNNNQSEGYGILSFTSPEAVATALEKGDGNTIRGNAIRVSELEPKAAHLHANNMAPQSSVLAVTNLFSKFQAFAVSDIVTTERCYAFIKFEERESAENAKRELNKTILDSVITVRYAEAEQSRSTIQVQFQNSDDPDVEQVKKQVEMEFKKYGTCTVEADKWADGKWRRLAVVTYKGENASTAASKAMENVTKVGKYNVWCQFARCLVPRVPPTLRPSIELPYAPDYSMYQQGLGTTNDPNEAAEKYKQTETAQGLERGIQYHLVNSVPQGSNMQFSCVPGYTPGMAVQEQIEVAVPVAEMPQYYFPPPMPMYWSHMGYIQHAPPPTTTTHPYYMHNHAPAHGMMPMYSPAPFVPMAVPNMPASAHAPAMHENMKNTAPVNTNGDGDGNAAGNGNGANGYGNGNAGSKDGLSC